DGGVDQGRVALRRPPCSCLNRNVLSIRRGTVAADWRKWANDRPPLWIHVKADLRQVCPDTPGHAPDEVTARRLGTCAAASPRSAWETSTGCPVPRTPGGLWPMPPSRRDAHMGCPPNPMPVPGVGLAPGPWSALRFPAGRTGFPSFAPLGRRTS